jgi:hypothetical protein
LLLAVVVEAEAQEEAQAQVAQVAFLLVGLL